LRPGSIAPEGEIRIEGQRSFDFGLRFIEPAKFHESRSKIETPSGIVPVQLDRALIEIQRLPVFAKIQLGEGDIRDPNICIRVARTGMQRFAFMALGFLGMTVE